MTSAPTNPMNASAIKPLGMTNRRELDRNQDPNPMQIIHATEVDTKNKRKFFTRGWEDFK
jgi:hypothetical protein